MSIFSNTLTLVKFLAALVSVFLFLVLYASPSQAATGSSVKTPTGSVSDFSCSYSSLVSLKSEIVSCSFSSDVVFSFVTIKFSDGRSPSPVPSRKDFVYTDTAPVYSSRFSFPLTLWKSSTVSFVFVTSNYSFSAEADYFFKVKPSVKPVKYPADSLLKKNHFENPDPRPVGSGVNATVSRIPGDVRKYMSGVSHQKGCVPFKDLRLVSFNYYSIDGFIYRGFLVSHKKAASRVRSIVESLFDYRFPLHSAHLPDVYGIAPSGKGADDYKSMASGNTSMFNCRYVVGKESSKVLSPHAYGTAIDINTWENPYVSRTGVYPNRFWLDNRGKHVLVFSKNHKVVKLLAKHGFSWGGSFRDYHHFQL